MNNCIFCKIIDGEIKSKKVFENDLVYAFEDLNPQAPVHILIIPKKHIVSIDTFEKEDEKYIIALFNAIQEIAKMKHINEDGYRIVSNHKERAGQSVFHLHIHLLGGRNMEWPPG